MTFAGSGFYSEAPEDFLPDDMCATTEWTGWSECSTTCGKGYELRTRRFLNRMGRKKCPHVDTTERKNCAGAVASTCPESTQITGMLASPDCAVTSWSQWSPCSVSCGKFQNISYVLRNLHFIKYENSKIGWLLHYESL